MATPATDRARRLWTIQEDEKLRLLVSYWGDQSGKNGHWDKISSHFDNRTAKDCRKRWFHSLDPKLRRGKWSQEEDRILVDAYKKLGPAWQRIAQQIPGRTDDQCSKRYKDVLNPVYSERLREWTPHEDEQLLVLVELHGTKWSDIAKEMDQRTGLTCRNRWRKLSRDKQKASGGAITQSHDSPGDDDLASLESPPTVSSSGPSILPDERPQSMRIAQQHHQQQLGRASSNISQAHLGYAEDTRGRLNPMPSRLVEPTVQARSQSGPNIVPGQVGNQPIRSYTLTLDNPQNYESQLSSGTHYPISESDLGRILEFAAARDQKVVIHQHIYQSPEVIGPENSRAMTPGIGSGMLGGNTLSPMPYGHNNKALFGHGQHPYGYSLDSSAIAGALSGSPYARQEPPGAPTHLPIPQLAGSSNSGMTQSPRVLPETAQPPDELITGPSNMYDPEVRGNAFDLSEASQFDFLSFNPS